MEHSPSKSMYKVGRQRQARRQARHKCRQSVEEQQSRCKVARPTLFSTFSLSKVFTHLKISSLAKTTAGLRKNRWVRSCMEAGLAFLGSGTVT